MEHIRKEIKAKLEYLADTLASEADYRDIEPADFSFYEMGLDSDGIPIRSGNSDDVYSDGFESGHKAGEHNALSFILDLIEKENA